MKYFRVYTAKKVIYISGFIVLLMLGICLYIKFHSNTNVFSNPNGRTIVVDAGHGGIDGGTSADGVLEKDINLDIAKRVKWYLEKLGYIVILTRDKDVSLENLCRKGGSRHQRDLNARVDIFNKNKADIFLSIHVDSNFKNPEADGSIIFYNENYPENGNLAYCIQRELNSIVFNNRKRTVRNPQKGNYYILYYSKIPGVIVETAFISNLEERRLLTTEEFKDTIAQKISDGVEKYFLQMEQIKSTLHENNY